MNKIVLGKAGQTAVECDVDTLLLTRMLITANSGGGKSYLTRVLLELLRPKVQEIVIDAEDEFSSLREKYDFAQIGEGGVAPMDVRSAGILAERLLEHRISAVCNLYEVKAHLRPVWVRNFCEALMNAPKKWWHHVVIVLDEAQMFAPENGKSESFNAVVDLATRGRKRGFCLIPAVQRLADLTKKVTAQMLNRLVGQTFEDLDQDRAISVLSVAKADQQAFREELKNLEPGHFYALGRAISKSRILFKVRKAQTTHPEPGKVSTSALPQLPPDRLKDLLSKLADLPKAAEEKAKNEAELRTEIRTLKAELSRAQAVAKAPPPVTLSPRQVPAPAPREVKVPLLHEKDIKRVEGAIGRLERVVRAVAAVGDAGASIKEAAKTLETSLAGAVQAARVPAPVKAPIAPVRVSMTRRAAPLKPVVAPRPRLAADAAGDGSEPLSEPQMRILMVLSFFHALGVPDVPRSWVAPLAGTCHSSGGYGNNLGRLRSRGYLDYRRPNTMCLTTSGVDIAGPAEMLNSEQILGFCMQSVTTPQGAILQSLKHTYPEDIAREDLAASVGVPATSGGYGNNLGALRSAGMIVYTSPGRARLADWVTGEVKEAALAI